MATTITNPATQTRTAQREKRPWLWNVVLLNDEAHTYDYVMEMMGELFAHPQEKAFKIAARVDEDGRAVCLTTHKEHAELKCEQVHGFGLDRSIAGCVGAMSAIIEPAEFGEGDGEEGKESGKGGAAG